MVSPTEPAAATSGRRIAAAGAALAGVAVLLGAFGAHGLRGALSAADLATYETAVRYLMWHALGLVGLGAFQERMASKPLAWAAWAIFVAVLLFSGSLITLALTDWRALVALPPLGGAAMVMAWGAAAWALWKAPT